VGVLPETGVVLDLKIANPAPATGAQQLIAATLFDGQTPIVASSVTAEVLLPNSSTVAVQLRDDQTGGDKTAGDRVYTGTFTGTQACGNYRVRVTATGSSSEGTVTRQQPLFFQAHVPGSAFRDPCDPDDDDDLLTDSAELDMHQTDPGDPDTDDDLCRDDRELGPNENIGGRRDPTSFWDFFSVFTGNPLIRDTAIGGADLAAVVARFGSTDDGAGTFNRNSDPLSTPTKPVLPSSNRANYHPDFDRSGSAAGSDAWDLLPPNGNIGAAEIANVVAQFGDHCA